MIFRPIVPDFPDHLACDGFGVYGVPSIAGDFADIDQQIGGHRRLAGHPTTGVLGQTGVQDSVRDLVTELVRVPLADRFAGKHVVVA